MWSGECGLSLGCSPRPASLSGVRVGVDRVRGGTVGHTVSEPIQGRVYRAVALTLADCDC